MVLRVVYWKTIHSPAHVHQTIVDNFVTITLVTTVQTVSTTSSSDNMTGIYLVDIGQSVGHITTNNIVAISGASIGVAILIIAFLVVVVVVVVVKRKRRHRHMPMGMYFNSIRIF